MSIRQIPEGVQDFHHSLEAMIVLANIEYDSAKLDCRPDLSKRGSRNVDIRVRFAKAESRYCGLLEVRDSLYRKFPALREESETSKLKLSYW